jgi:hypothetical protein
MHRTRTIALLGGIAATLLLGACSDDGDEPAVAPVETTTTEAPEVFDPDGGDDEADEDADDAEDAEVFDPDAGGDDDEDTGAADGPFESAADEEAFCAAADEYATLVADEPFADEAATERTLDEGNDLLEDMAFALTDGPERELVEEVEDPLLDLYEVGDDSGNDPAVVTSDPAYDAWLDVQDEALAPLLDDLCGIELG